MAASASRPFFLPVVISLEATVLEDGVCHDRLALVYY